MVPEEKFYEVVGVCMRNLFSKPFLRSFLRVEAMFQTKHGSARTRLGLSDEEPKLGHSRLGDRGWDICGFKVVQILQKIKIMK